MSENFVLKFLEFSNTKKEIFKQVVLSFLAEDKKLSTDLIELIPNSLVNKDFIEQFSLFLKYAINSDFESSTPLEGTFKKFGLLNIENKDHFVEVLSEVLRNYRKNLLSKNLVDYSWQLAVIDKENDSVSKSKYDKVEVDFKFKVNENEKTETQNIIKLNYYEFSEIHENLKKIENQLKAFK